jgi:hypothetical protein
MSADRTAANRKNAKASTGPKTAEGKRRSAGNARRHGFSVPPLEEGEVSARISLLAAAFLGATPRTEVSWCLALDAARAQYTLDLLRLRRQRLIAEADADPATFTGPRRRSDRGVMIGTIKLARAGADFGGIALQEMFSRLRREAPRGPLRRRVELFTRIAAELEKLDRYELRATGRRRNAIFALDLFMARGTSE